MENYCQTVPITVSFFSSSSSDFWDPHRWLSQRHRCASSEFNITSSHYCNTLFKAFFSKSMEIKTWIHSLSTWFMLFDVLIFTSHFTEVFVKLQHFIVIVFTLNMIVWNELLLFKKERTVKLKGQCFTFTGQQNNRRRLRLSRQAVNINHCCRLVW